MADPVKVQRGLNADLPAADDGQVLSKRHLIAERSLAGVYVASVDAGDGLGTDDRAAGSPDQHVRPERGDRFSGGRFEEPNRNARLNQLHVVVLRQPDHVGLHIRCGRRKRLAADGAGLFPKLHIVARLLCQQGSSAAAGAAADHKHLFRRFGMGHLTLILVPGEGVQGAGHMLIFQNVADAALVAGNAGADILRAAFRELLRQFRIGEQAATDDGKIADVVLQGGLRLFVVGQSAVGQHGNGDVFLDRLRGLELHDRFLIENGGHGELPLLIATCVHMQAVHAVFRQILCQLDALVQLTEAGVRHAVVGAELHDHGSVRSGDAAHSVDLLQQEGRTPLHVAAVLVRAGVPRGGQELVVEVAAVGVHLISVHASGARQLDCTLRLADQLLNFLDRQFVAFHVGRVEPAARRRTDRDRVHLCRACHAAAAGHQLYADLAASCVSAVAQLLEK